MKNTYFKLMLLTSAFVVATSLYSAAAAGNFDAQFNAFKAQASRAAQSTSKADIDKLKELSSRIVFTNPEEVERFNKFMIAISLNKSARESMIKEAVQKVILHQDSLRQVLVANPDLAASLEKENPDFWNGLGAWLAELGQAVKDAALAGIDKVKDNASAGVDKLKSGFSAASDIVSNAFSSGRTHVLNLSSLQDDSIANPGFMRNGPEYDRHVASIGECNSFENLQNARNYLIRSNNPSSVVTTLGNLYSARSLNENVLRNFVVRHNKDYEELNKLLESLYEKYEGKALALFEKKDTYPGIDMVQLYANLKAKRGEKTPYGKWLGTQFGCWDRLRWVFSCGTKPKKS